VAVVGSGIIGKHHARVLTAHPSFSVAALIDTNPAAARAGAKDVTDAGGPPPALFGSIGEAAATLPIDLVAITTPAGLHLDAADHALALGKHVIIEKPLDVDLAAARAFAARAAAAPGQLVSVISQHRFDPATVAVKEAITAGRFGTVVSGQAATTWYRSREYYEQASWRGTWAQDGGVSLNQGIHTIDVLRWMLGRPLRVFAATGHYGHRFLEVDDTAAATVTFHGGAIATIFATTAAYPGLTTRVTIDGTAGSAVVENDRLAYFHAGTPSGVTDTLSTGTPTNQAAQLVGPEDLPVAPGEPESFADGHVRQYDDIAAALAEGREPGVTVEEALLSLALVRAMYVSATLEEPVDFDKVLAGDYDEVKPSVRP
jgi:predicted dehydrogenase